MNLKNVLAMSAAVTLAASLAGCSKPDHDDLRVCRDDKGVRVDDRLCQPQAQPQNAVVTNGGHSSFVWFYMAHSSPVPAVGQSFGSSNVGTYRPTAGTTYTSAPRSAVSSVSRASFTSTSVSRGGFGGVGHGSVGS